MNSVNNYIHKDLAAGRWFKLSFSEQMGNIGSEVYRALSWKERGNEEYSENAFYRTLDLIDLTIKDPRWRKRLKEPCRIRELICDFFFGDNIYKTTPQFLKNYFDYFAFKTRIGSNNIKNNPSKIAI